MAVDEGPVHQRPAWLGALRRRPIPAYFSHSPTVRHLPPTLLHPGDNSRNCSLTAASTNRCPTTLASRAACSLAPSFNVADKTPYTKNCPGTRQRPADRWQKIRPPNQIPNRPLSAVAAEPHVIQAVIAMDHGLRRVVNGANDERHVCGQRCPKPPYPIRHGDQSRMTVASCPWYGATFDAIGVEIG